MDYMVTPFHPAVPGSGDYVGTRDGNLASVTGAMEVRQMVYQALLNRKGYFLYDEGLGSDLWKLPRDYTAIPDTARTAEGMALEALHRQLPGVVADVEPAAAVVGTGVDLAVSYRIIATGEVDTVTVTWRDLQNA